ncbi:MAG TPA: hypothetical protein VGS58_12990 [Candidatus Sulfopaludibacter sp.]|nr:hypothetical protein [Candidatus Sulfopaludibacter sp.]
MQEPVYLITRLGRLMPGTLEEQYSAGEREMCVVRASSGKCYTADAENVLTARQGQEAILRERAREMVRAGYQVALRSDRTLRVYQPHRHGAAGGWILTAYMPGRYCCNCPAYAGAVIGCKHVAALAPLLHAEAAAATLAGKPRHAATYSNLAAEIMFPDPAITPAP